MTKAQLQAENDRLKKLLNQCMEREQRPLFNAINQDTIDEAVGLTHDCYKHLFWRLCWYRDFSI